MNNKKGMKKNNLIKDILLLGSVAGGCFGIICLLLPGFYYLFVALLSFLVKVLGIVLIGGAALGLIFVAVGLATKGIVVENVYQFTNNGEIDENVDLMRQQLHVVKGNTRVEERTSSVPSSNYSYLFDNNYEDTPDLEIDDMVEPYLKMASNDNQEYRHNVRRKIKTKERYRGKYLR